MCFSNRSSQWSTPNLGMGSQFVPNYRTGGRIYVIKLPALSNIHEEHEAPVTEDKLNYIYNSVYCSDEAKNVHNEPKDQLIKLPFQHGLSGYNNEHITYRHLVKIYQVLYGMPSAALQAQSRWNSVISLCFLF